MKKQNKGFTLVELLIVIVIIGILAAIIVPSVSSAIEKANLANDQSDVKNMNTLIALKAIEEDVDYFDAAYLQEYLASEGYTLIPKASSYSYWYDTEKNAIVLDKTEDALATGNAITSSRNVVFAAGETHLEAVRKDKPAYLYIDKAERPLTEAIDTIRNLASKAIADGADKNSPEAVVTKMSAFFAELNTNNYDDFVKALFTGNHFAPYNPETTVHVSEEGFFGGTVNGNNASNVTSFYIAGDVKTIPTCNLSSITFGDAVATVEIDVPLSVQHIEIRAFTTIKGAGGDVDVTIVNNSNKASLDGYIVADGIKTKGKTNVSTMKEITVYYVYDAIVEGVFEKDYELKFKPEQKNYLPFMWKECDAETEGAKEIDGKYYIQTADMGKFVVDTDSIKHLINSKTQVVVNSTFDRGSGFQLLRAYIMNTEDGTIVAGIIVQYMYVEEYNV